MLNIRILFFISCMIWFILQNQIIDHFVIDYSQEYPFLYVIIDILLLILHLKSSLVGQGRHVYLYPILLIMPFKLSKTCEELMLHGFIAFLFASSEKKDYTLCITPIFISAYIPFVVVLLASFIIGYLQRPTTTMTKEEVVFDLLD